MTTYRTHYNFKAGAPKIGYATWAEAEAAARRRMVEWGVPMQPYACRSCPKFHVGQARLRPPSNRLDWLEPELGIRVIYHLTTENQGNAYARRHKIDARFRSAERVQVRDASLVRL